MTDWHSRYIAGSETDVWNELTALTPASLADSDTTQQAVAVCTETMRRVATNIDRIIERLDRQGYLFADPPLTEYPPGTTLRGHRFPPTASVPAAIVEIENAVGPVPMALQAFWREVGSVALVGEWPLVPVTNDMTDPLWVYGPDATLTDIHDFAEEDDWDPVACIAPDNLHKGNISGGAPCSIPLGRACVDAPLGGSVDALAFTEPDPTFVEYLRSAILVWGGFPGFRYHRDAFPPELRATLTADLVRF